MTIHTPHTSRPHRDVVSAASATPPCGCDLANSPPPVIERTGGGAFIGGSAYSDIQEIPLFHYNLIMADPPWTYDNWSSAGEGKNAAAKYTCMSFDDIAAMPVNHLAAPDCALWLWATNPLLDQAFALMKAWGFQFKTAGHWSKKTVKGNQAFGTGYILRSAGEPFLIGTVGKPKFARNVRSVIEGPVREHSRKPEESYEAAERLVPNANRLDFFSRQVRHGWDCFGNETSKFEVSA